MNTRFTKETFPKQWFMEVTYENYHIADQWRTKKAGKHNLFNVGCILLSKHLRDGTYFHMNPIKIFKQINDYCKYQQITTDEFLLHVFNEIVIENQTITRDNLKKIYAVACLYWQTKLQDLVKKQGVFADEYVLTNEFVCKMFKASSSNQKALLKKIGLVEITDKRLSLFNQRITSPDGEKTYENPITDIHSDDLLISVRGKSEIYYGKAYYLNSDFNWELVKDEQNALILVPTFK